MGLYGIQHLWNGRFSLKRHSREGEHYSLVTIFLLWNFKLHTRGRTKLIRYYFAAVWDKCLGLVKRAQRYHPSGREYSGNYLQLFLILHICCGTGKFAKCLLGNVILCGAQAACNYHYIAGFEGSFHCIYNILLCV